MGISDRWGGFGRDPMPDPRTPRWMWVTVLVVGVLCALIRLLAL